MSMAVTLQKREITAVQKHLLDFRADNHTGKLSKKAVAIQKNC